jgi:hypothetical protein
VDLCCGSDAGRGAVKLFGGSTILCMNIDECTSPTFNNNCNLHATCTDNPEGSFFCTCSAGYGPPPLPPRLVRGFTASCSTSLSCRTQRDASCRSDVRGALACTEGDGVFCSDINECAAGGTHNCNIQATCTDTVGSFTCACKAGYSAPPPLPTLLENPSCGADAKRGSGTGSGDGHRQGELQQHQRVRLGGG